MRHWIILFVYVWKERMQKKNPEQEKVRKTLQTLQSWYSKYTVKQLAIVDLSKHFQIYSEIKTSSYSWTNRFFQSCIATISELHRRLLQKQTAKATDNTSIVGAQFKQKNKRF